MASQATLSSAALDRWQVFVGPSISVHPELEARIDVRAPIRRGDLPSLVSAGFKRFAIIDGEFGQSLSVSVEEIRSALASGATITGAASMGALRAAETYPLGMIGYGWIWEQYRDGLVESDEEVAVVFDRDSGRSLSLPMINVRWATRCALDAGVLTADDVEAILAAASALPYHLRSYRALLSGAAPSDAMRRFVAWVQAQPNGCDRKALDAALLLDAITADREALRAASPMPRPVLAQASMRPPSAADFLFDGDCDRDRKLPGTHRVRSRDAVMQAAERAARRVGVTRACDITGLDSLELPCFSSVRPFADERDITVTGGKGFTREDARLGALIEAIERACLSPVGRAPLRASLHQLSDVARVLHPSALVLEADTTWTPERAIDWWPMRDVVDGRELLVPSHAVFFPDAHEPWMFWGSTTGTAAGSTRSEALLYALLEVIERDLTAHAEWFRTGRPLRLETIDDPALRALIDRLASNGLELRCWIVENEWPVPLCYATIEDPARRDPLYVNGGMAVHLDGRVAVTSAVLEAVYSRLTAISGAREDLEREKKHVGDVDYDVFRSSALDFKSGAPIAFGSLQDLSTPRISSDLELLLDACVQVGCPHVLACDLSLEESELFVVRCVVPGAEQALTPTRVGPRWQRWCRVANELSSGIPLEPYQIDRR